MENLKIKDIVKACNGKLLFGNEEEIVEGFSKDTRNINKGEIYVGIKGENFDGNSYYIEALEKGAIGAIIEEVYQSKLDLSSINNKNIIIVKDRN